MNLHFLWVLSLGQAEAACFVPGCLYAATGAASKSPFSIPASLDSVRSALWLLTMKRQEAQKQLPCLPCGLELSVGKV